MTSIYNKKTRVSDNIILSLIYLCVFFAIAVLAGIIGYVFVKGLPAINWDFISTAPDYINNTFGILPNIINTLYIIIITLLIATPIGVGSAIYLNEYAKGGKLVKLIEFTTETLAGIPSIIYGLFGMVMFGITFKLGYSILCGSLTLTLMILPIITRTTQEALKTVPESYRSGALGIGATKWYMIRTIILPSAMPGIVTGIILSVGRIVGESAALLFTAGSVANLPHLDNLFGHSLTSGGSLTIQLYLSMSKAKYDQAFGIALILIVFVFIINLITKLIAKKLDVENKKD